MALRRQYVVSIAAAATTTIQMTQGGSLKRAIFSIIPAAAGTWELSRSSTSQIASATPDTGVIARARIAAGQPASGMVFEFDTPIPVKTLDNLYLHSTGAGNVGELTLQ